MRAPDSYESWLNPKSWEPVHAQADFADPESGEAIVNHHGSVRWNAFRKKWTFIFTQQGGKSSLLGEIWYAEADQPEGPWDNAVKVLTHDRYSFYNPVQHLQVTEAESPFIYFEGLTQIRFLGIPIPLHDTTTTKSSTGLIYVINDWV